MYERIPEKAKPIFTGVSSLELGKLNTTLTRAYYLVRF